jgi:hypothetical protein
VFNCYGNERLTSWKQFRDTLEVSTSPFEDVVELWSHAPFVSAFINPHTPESWPDPWHLIIDGKFDDLAIVLGMLYTLKLTKRFRNAEFVIHMDESENKTPSYWLVINGKYVLNYYFKEVITVENLPKSSTSILQPVKV